ncbi:tagatose-6-phosphate kinase, partial [Microvirga sp. 3-52]|nr:tagatose-6-phosphate kinase [Microvirga sp. 3-52]
MADVSKTAGGKGLNVARVLHQLGEEVAASGFLGGSLGSFISAELKAIGIEDLFVPIEGETRNCIAILHEGKQTEILESGPIISKTEAELFLTNFEEHLSRVDLVTISGSLPKGLSSDFYAKLIEISNPYGTKVLLDANGALLTSTLNSASKPYLIKPNEEEMAELIGKSTIDEIE